MKGLARNVKREFVDGNFDIRHDSLIVKFIAAPAPRNITGMLEFKIEILNDDSLVLNTSIGNLNYSKVVK